MKWLRRKKEEKPQRRRKVYFEPQADITAMEIAAILKPLLEERGVIYERLPENVN